MSVHVVCGEHLFLLLLFPTGMTWSLHLSVVAGALSYFSYQQHCGRRASRSLTPVKVNSLTQNICLVKYVREGEVNSASQIDRVVHNLNPGSETSSQRARVFPVE